MRKILFSILGFILFLFVLGSVVFISLRNSNNIDASDLKVYLTNEEDLQDGILGSDSRLLFTGDDIKEYNWENHEIIFNPEFLKKINIDYTVDINEKFFSEGSKILEAKYTDRFLLFLNDEKIYRGYFKYPMYSSYYPVGAIIEDIENGIKINFNSIEDITDVRSDNRIYNFLKDKKLLSK